MWEQGYGLTVSGGVVSCRLPTGEVERVALEALELVVVATDDSGPFGLDLWWLLFTNPECPLRFPGGSTGEEAVLEALESLPGFDHEALIAAMACTEEAHFVLWKCERLRELCGD